MSSVLWRSGSGGLRCLLCPNAPPYHINDEEGRQNHEDARGHQTRLTRWGPCAGRPGWLQCTLCPRVTAAESNLPVQADHLCSHAHRRRLLTEVQANLCAASSSSQPAATDLTPRQMQLRAVDAMWSHVNDTDMRCDCCPSFHPIHKNNRAAQQSHVAGQRHIKAYEKYRQSFALHGSATSSAGQPPDPRNSSSRPHAVSSASPASAAAASSLPSVWIPGDREGWLQCRMCRVFIRAVHMEAKDSHVVGEQHRKALAKFHGAHSSQGYSSASAAGQPLDPRQLPVSASAPALRVASAVPPATLGIPPQKLKKNQLSEWFNNKRGVVVMLPPELPDLGRFLATQIPIVCVGQEAVFSIQVWSSVAPSTVRLKRCRLIHLDQRKPLEKMRPEADKALTINSPLPTQLSSSTPLRLDLRVKPTLNKGRVSTHLLLEFEDSSSSFVIIRSITVRMASADEAQLVVSPASGSSSNGSTGSGSNDQLSKKRLSSWERRLAHARKSKDDREVVPAPPVDGRGVKPVVPLKRYDLPGYLRREMPSPHTKTIISNVEESVSDHLAKLRTLKYLEEYEQEVELSDYDLRTHLAQQSWRNGRFVYSLRVEGLLEGRPSVIVGDKIIVALADTGKQRFEGRVMAVQQLNVLLSFNERFNHSAFNSSAWFDVSFQLQRKPLKAAHRALEFMGTELWVPHDLAQALLFPKLAPPHAIPPLQPMFALGEPFNARLNEQQLQAVGQVVSGDYRPYPYIILGPPGTGKTTVDIECMLQLLSHNEGNGAEPTVRILACATSNSATDLLVERLSSTVGEQRMLRFNGFNRNKDTMQKKELLMRYSRYDEEEQCFPAPLLATMLEFEVVAVTLTHSTELLGIGVPKGHFTHIFIDECGHADESESFIPLAGLVTKDTCVVLSGDPKQLGPQIRSPIAGRFGLGVSWIERLVNDRADVAHGELEIRAKANSFVIPTIEHSPYARAEEHSATGLYNARYITKLLDNYRSHAELLTVPNKLFYHSELVPCAAEAQQNLLLDFKQLPNPAVPFVFIGTDGQNCQEADSASFFNPDEVIEVVRQVRALTTQYPPQKLPREEIAIITPYRKQVQKLRTALRMLKLSDAIKVGTVEEFQGQERSVIIISTVRSHLGVDVDPENKSTIGFLSNPKRFNVAVTRAKSLLIMVGDPAMLKQDPCWLELLRHAKEKDAYKGVDWADQELEGDEDNSEEGDGWEESKMQSDSTDDTSEYDFAEAAQETPLERKN